MPIDVSSLEVSLEEGERWRRTLRITVPANLMQAERKAAVKQLSSRLRLPGFRAGRVPDAVVEKRFGQTLEQELLDRVIGEAYRGALQEESLRPISEGEIGEVDYQPHADLTFRVSFDIAPDIDLSRVGGFKIQRPPVEVADADVQKVLDRLREQEGTWVPIESGSPQEGEKVSVRIQQIAEQGSEPRAYEFTLGKGEAIPDVEEAIKSLEVGATDEFTIQFPDDADSETGPGDEQRLRITLDSRKQLELPELDDEFARAVGEFETVDELDAKVREDLMREAEREAEAGVRGSILEQIVAANPFEIPESMIDQYVRSALGDPEELAQEQLAEAKEQLRPRAIATVKRYLIIDRVAETEGLTATSEEVDERIEEIAERSGTPISRIYGQLQKSGQLERLEREITERKVFDFLKNQSEIVAAA
ncbi:MAG: trigger factor [Gemmatimonadota bacterium]